MLLHPARPWDLRPIDDDDPPAPGPGSVPGTGGWPRLGVVIPARNEARSLGPVLAALGQQDYPGDITVVVVDERSSDATGEVARAMARVSPRPVQVMTGADLPEGWAGKVWGMEQGLRALEARGAPPDWVVLTDADIHHAPESLRCLVFAALSGDVGLESRLARLRCRSAPERLLIPPFVLFFLLLYPPRWANRAGSRVASAAGGCILLRRDALRRADGFEAIKGALIDDLAVARLMKARAGLPTRLALSRSRVVSTRPYDDLASVWAMVRRSAFTQLRRSWLLLAGVLAVMALMFAGPLVALVAGAVGATAGCGAAAWWAAGLGAGAWAAMAVAAGPVNREFGLGWPWRLALPVSGLLYGAMTLDSGLRGPRGDGWR